MSVNIKLLMILFIAITQLNCKQKEVADNQNGSVEVVTPADFKEKSKGQLIIDIRTPQEFQQGYIEGAVNINYFDRDFLEKISQYDKSKPVFVYCRSGNRTSSASRKIAVLGFEKVYDLQGGILNWMRNNNQIVKK